MQHRRSPVLSIRIIPMKPSGGGHDDSSSEDSFRLDDVDDTHAQLDTLMDQLKEQMAVIHRTSTHVRTQMKGLMKRAKKESIQWMDEPLQPKTAAVRSWVRKHGLPARPTLQEFLDASFASAESLDLETRMLTFSKADANSLWGGAQRLSVFDLLTRLPAVFE
jgi:hypothetical protein